MDEISTLSAVAKALGCPMLHDGMLAAITALRQSSTAPPGCVRVGEVDHKLLGTLPMTADGCVVGSGAPVYCGCGYQCWTDHTVDSGTWSLGPKDPQHGEHRHYTSACYSTREAALAAQAAGDGGKGNT